MTNIETQNLENSLSGSPDELFNASEFSLVYSGHPPEIDEHASIKKIQTRSQELATFFQDEKTAKRLLASASILAEVEKLFFPVKEKLKSMSMSQSLVLRQSTQAEIVRFQAELESCKSLVAELFLETRAKVRRMYWDGATAGSVKACHLLLGEFARLGVQLSLSAASSYPDLNLQRLGANVFKLSGLLLELAGESRAATEDLMSSLGVK